MFDDGFEDDEEELTAALAATGTAGATGGKAGGATSSTAPVLPRKQRGETEMAVLKYKLAQLGTKTTERDGGLQQGTAEHNELYAVPAQVARSFTRTYLGRATGKLSSLLNKPRLRSTDALHGEQLEVSEGEYRAHALTRMEMHAREQAIYAGHRVGWREKLSHAQVQRGVEARKLETELKRAPVSEANRAAMKRRGRDSDSDGESKEGEGEGGSHGLARSASAAAGVSATGGAAATPASSGSNS